MITFTLAIETSSAPASVAIAREGAEPIVYFFEGARPDIGKLLIPGIDALVTKAGFEPAGIVKILAGAGPGTFTGLRIGLAAAKSLAFVSRAPIFAFPSFVASAFVAFREFPQFARAAVAIDALRGDFGAALYERDGGVPRELLAPALANAADLRTRFASAEAFITDRPDLLRSIIDDHRPIVSAKPDAAQFIVLERLGAKPLSQVSPIYLRASAAEEQAKLKLS
ncbi:MAG: tRNA (adenosine(37)-N6)-threonylcarbamoyltransferase complex dimerization subunit type 1 TsaB [Planctomycetota bacterium]